MDGKTDTTLKIGCKPNANSAGADDAREGHLAVHRAIERVRAEYLEMPGLRLTSAQVERLCGIEQTICNAVLDALVDARFLRLGTDGTYARLTDGGIAGLCTAPAERVSRR
jgi:hypothetical protein